jgi:hypothetical protein
MLHCRQLITAITSFIHTKAKSIQDVGPLRSQTWIPTQAWMTSSESDKGFINKDVFLRRSDTRGLYLVLASVAAVWSSQCGRALRQSKHVKRNTMHPSFKWPALHVLRPVGPSPYNLPRSRGIWLVSRLERSLKWNTTNRWQWLSIHRCGKAVSRVGITRVTTAA